MITLYKSHSQERFKVGASMCTIKSGRDIGLFPSDCILSIHCRSAASSPPQPMLCMLAIPSSLRCADLLNFVAPAK